ncbi:polysaccharide biosynthesis protein [Neiella marina]|uniref:Polysaccharide biosynthesis protein n=1 Tax=Neiella holothuriorum TaxID=2870530 RepID=A0ABS7EDZ7_9GAMM|nr:nucleoside-diphosphate sugar epimerase/dehydratase [Neiella holothuriorum]MBW8190543.1 polysaccharide biosynthesis protein [Neiella holothuriorum]
MKINDLLDRLPRRAKQLVVVGYDVAAMSTAFVLAFWLRLGWSSSELHADHFIVLLTSVALAVGLAGLTGVYRAVTRFMTGSVWLLAISCVVVSAAFMHLAGMVAEIFIPRSIPILFGAMSVFAMSVPRVLLSINLVKNQIVNKEKVVIFGVGSAGRQLVTALNTGIDYHPVAFVDEKQRFVGSTVLGLSVYSLDQLDKLKARHGRIKILLALPDTTADRRRELIHKIEPHALEVLQVPRMSDIVSGKHRIDELRPVKVEEVLGREPVQPIKDLFERNIRNKVVMVTGAGGSIGSELCRQVLAQQPRVLIFFELAEFNLYQIDNELAKKAKEQGTMLVSVLGSVLDGKLMRSTMNQYRVDTVYHAAAYKHVPIVEANSMAGVRNNIFGTKAAAEAAIECNVETFVLVSTDKAVRPTNVMGATKRFAELVLQALAQEPHGTRFVMVRFGNVLDSSGSVMPLFKKQISEGGPITVTHPEIIRYFMTIPEAAQLVIQAGAMGTGGNVYVLDMGAPVRIVELAYKMAHLMGRSIRDERNPHGDIEVRFTGLRPGEKLYEELLIGNDTIDTQHPRIMSASEVSLPLSETLPLLDRLDSALTRHDVHQIKRILLEAPLAYDPSEPVMTLVSASDKKLAAVAN